MVPVRRLELARIDGFTGQATNAVMYHDSVLALQNVRDGESSTAMLSGSTFEIWGDGNSTETQTAKHNSGGVCDWGIDELAPSSGSATFNSFHTMPGSQLEMSAESWHGKPCSRQRTLSVCFENDLIQILQGMFTCNDTERITVP